MTTKQQIPIDPVLRANALQIIEIYKNTKPQPGKDPLDDQMQEAVVGAMRLAEEMIAKYDRRDLSVSMQRELIRLLKKIVKKYSL